DGEVDGGGLLLGRTTLPYLAALSTRTVDVPIDTSMLLGARRLVVVVDRLEKILETSDANNEAVLSTFFYPADRTPPSSYVLALPAVTLPTRFLVRWEGDDLPARDGGSGVASFDVFVSIDGGRYDDWLVGTAARSAYYSGGEGHHYAFYSVATDNVGNREDA